MQSISGAWRALSSLCQVAIGTSQPVTDVLPFGGTDLFEPEPGQFFTNKDEVTGGLTPTKHQLLNMKMAGKHKAKATPTSVALFVSMALGNDTAAIIGTTTAYTHKSSVSAAIVSLPCRTLVENDGAKQFSYVGVACTGFTLSGQRDGYVELEADLIGRGSEAADATAQPAASAESYLTYQNCDFSPGGTYDGTAVTGGASIAARLVSFKLDYKNGAKGIYAVGDASGYLADIRRGQMVDISVEAEVEIDNTRAERAGLLAGTEQVMHIPIVGGVANGTAHYGVDIVLPRVVLSAAKKAAKDGILQVAGKYTILTDPTYGSMDIRVTNLKATSYAATA
ncbi:MAG TPA: phage tail tube protein [Bryobacteraceae bacterium]|nr:phage tail tube protein [Bryobacteraceae bacterium]